VPKPSVIIVAVLLAAIVGYLAYDPSATQEAVTWAHRQLGVSKPSIQPMGTPNYMPVVPR
jgi:hypothetical protein